MSRSVASAFPLSPYFIEPQSYTFNTAAGINLQATTDRVAAKFYTAQAFTVDSVDVMFVKTNSPASVVVTLEIQTDSSDAPSGTTVGAVSANQTITTTNVWLGGGTPIALGASASLSANTPYWLVVKVVSATTLNSTNTWGLKHAGTGNVLNRSKLRRFNSTDWTTVTAVSAPPLIVLHNSSTGTYDGTPITAAAGAATDGITIGNGADNRKGLRFKMGAQTTLAGVLLKLGKTGTPANLLVEVYTGTNTSASYSETVAVGDITDQTEFIIWFTAPVAIAKGTSTYILLSAAASTAGNFYQTYTVPIQNQYISAIYPADWRHVYFSPWVPGTSTPANLTVDATQVCSIVPILQDPAADLSEAATSSGGSTGSGSYAAYPQYTAFTTSNGDIASGPCTLGQIVVTSAITGSIAINDSVGSSSGALVYTSPANPAVGTVLGLSLRTKKGAYLTAPSAGSFIVTWQ